MMIFFLKKKNGINIEFLKFVPTVIVSLLINEQIFKQNWK